MIRNSLILLVIYFFSCCSSEEDVIVMNEKGFPLIIELNKGETFHFKREANGKSTVKSIQLVDYQLFKEKNYWFDKSIGQENYYKAEVFIKVNSKDTILLSRAYQMPIIFEGLKIGIESIKKWEEHGNLEAAKLKDMKKEVRFSLALAEEPFAPVIMRYPIEDYIWHASSYYNSWNALVPYNHRYYHRGEDMAAIPDQLKVVAMFDGNIIASPIPNGDGKSNGFIVETPYGISYRYGHINTESFLSGLDSGIHVKSGEQIGLTGETWNGGKTQYSGPHLHVEFRYKDTKINPFPAMMEAYFRDYPDQIVAIAGGYRFIEQGEVVQLDGTRSLTREGVKIAKYQWITHNGDTIQNPLTELRITKPGLYSEQLLVTTEEGIQDRDFLQVRVYDPNRGKKIASRHVMYNPVRGISPRDSILFWNRIENTTSDVTIDFGDGTKAKKIEKEIYHQFEKSGNYVVTYSTTGPENEPAILQMEVKVDK